MNRGRERQRIFHSPENYEAFLKRLDEAHRRFGMEIHAYCLMGNHYHLLIKTLQGNRNIPRWIAMKLCQEVGSAKLTEIAELFEV